jgi:anaerobic selenocysteine-containing dehydrogenase
VTLRGRAFGHRTQAPTLAARCARDHVDHATQRLGAVQHRHRPADDLDALDVVDRDPVVLVVAVADHAVAGTDALAVDQHQRVAAVHAAQVDGLAAADRPALDGDARFAAHGVEQVVGAWVASTCQGCTQWCAIQIFVQDGRAVKVRGNPLVQDQPRLCLPARPHDPAADVRPGPHQDTDEAHQPAKGRGIDPKFVPISWDEALDTVAEKMMELRRAGEPGKLMYMRGRYSPTSTDLLYGTCPRSGARPTTSRTAPSAPKPRRWARA